MITAPWTHHPRSRPPPRQPPTTNASGWRSPAQPRMRAVDGSVGGFVVATPQVRSSWTKFVIAHAKAAPEPQRTQLLSALAPLRATIREAGLISWVDASVHAQVCARLVAGIGEAAALE